MGSQSSTMMASTPQTAYAPTHVAPLVSDTNKKAGFVMADPGPSQSPDVDTDWAGYSLSVRLRYGFPDRRDPRVIPVGWTCCKCRHRNTHPNAYGGPAEIEPGNTDHLKPCAGVNCWSRKRDRDGNSSPHSLCPECALTNHKRQPIMSGIGDWVGDVALSDFDRIDRAKIAFWECCHCLELNKISDSVSGRCFSCHFQSQSPGHCRKPDHPQLQIETLLALRCTKEYYFYPRFVHPTDYKVKPPTPAEKRQIEKLRRRREEDYREMERHNHRELMPLSAHVTCGDCRLLNGYKEYLIFADKEKRKFVKGGVLWGLVNARLLEWQQTNKRTPALLPEFEKHVWDQFRMRANVDACFRTIDQFKCYRAGKLIHRSSSLGNCDPDLYPQCSMGKTKKIMMKTIERRISSAVRYNQPSAVLMFCQKFRIMHDHSYFRDTRLDEVKRHRNSDFQSKPSPLRQCFTRQVPKTDRRLTIVGLVDRTRICSTNTAGQDEVEAEAYRQRHAAAQRRHAEFLRQYGEAYDEHEAFQRMLDFHMAALQRILADDLEQRKQTESSATNGHAHQEPPSAT